MKVERPFAYCCAEGGGRVEACDCVNKNHGTALFDVPDTLDTARLMKHMREEAGYSESDSAAAAAYFLRAGADAIETLIAKAERVDALERVLTEAASTFDQLAERGEGESPRRVQLSRKKGWRMPPNTVKVDRSTKWGNPFNWKDLPRYDQDSDDIEADRRSDALLRFYATVDFESAVKHDIGRPRAYPTNEQIRAALAGKNLACWCPLDQPCHADVLLELANPIPKDPHPCK